MKIGWIDFSDSERNKALDAISKFEEKGAVDEIGIGRIRDAFANKFFPGTSTIMTRAKYFFIVPYAFMDAVRNKKLTNYRQVIKHVEDNLEKECALTMRKQYPERGSGIIGTLILPYNWVSRKPSSIYWNGLRRLGIFTWDNITSIESYVRIALAGRDSILDKSKRKDDDAKEDSDDFDAEHNGQKPFWNVPKPDKNWMKNLSIDLNKDEASFLRKQISDSHTDTVFKVLLDNSIRIAEGSNFESVSSDIYDLVSDKNKLLIDLANTFNVLVVLIRFRYNIILSQYNNQDLIDGWDDFISRIPEIEDLDINQMMFLIGVNDLETMTFLTKSKRYLLEDRIPELDQWIIRREKALKGGRAKLLNPNNHNPEKTVALYFLDYRMNTARRIINDILDAEA